MTEKADAVLRVRVPASMLETLRECGEQERRKVSQIVRLAIEAYLERRGKAGAEEDEG